MSLSAEYYILDAVRNLDELSIPGIGSFRRKYIPATLDTVHNVLRSPSEYIEFSAEVEPRGLSYFKKYLKAQDEKLSISDVLQSIEAEVGRILNVNGKFKIQHLGHIYSRNGKIEVEWEANIHEKIFSNLHGFKDIQLPQKSISELTSAHAFPAATIPLKPEVQEKDKKEEGTPLPDAQVIAVPAALDPAPIPTEGPAQKALHSKRTTSGKKRKFPVLLILLLIILLGIPMAVIYMYPNILSPKEVATEQIKPLPENPAVVAEQTPKPAPTTESTESTESAPAPTTAPAATTSPAPTPASRAASSANAPAQSAVSQGYHLIVVSSKSEAEAQRVASEWSKQGYDAQVIPSDGATAYYRVSVLHSTQRSALVDEMIKLKDVTYSWILESSQ